MDPIQQVQHKAPVAQKRLLLRGAPMVLSGFGGIVTLAWSVKKHWKDIKQAFWQGYTQSVQQSHCESKNQ